MKNLLITFSGGRTSALMARVLIKSPKYEGFNKIVVFANTGKENEATLEFVKRCDEEFNLNVVWLEAVVSPEKGAGTNYKVVSFETASRNGEPFEAVIKKYGLPSKLYRHCTRELKEVPIHKYATEVFGTPNYIKALGIRADEKHRIGNKENVVYPLAELGVDNRFVRKFWDSQCFDLSLKDYEGNCDMCFLKSKRKRLTILKHNPEKAQWWVDVETNYTKPYQEVMDVRGNISFAELLEESKGKFTESQDLLNTYLATPTLFEDLDTEFDCFCKSY